MVMDVQERDRRYHIIKGKMSAQRLDALIVINSAQINEKGFVKYLTNYRSILYNCVAIFPADGEARLLVPSPVQKYWANLLGWIPRTEDQSPSLEESLSRNIKEMGLSKARLGLINTRIMPARTYLTLVGDFPEAEFVDATSILEETRMVKSPEERILVRKAASLAVLSFKVLPELLRPGITECGVIAEIDRRLIEGGAEDIFHLFSSKPKNLFPYAPTGRTIENGDVVILNTELSGPGGYWIQMVRTSFVGRTDPDVERMYDVLIEITSRLPSLLKAGERVGNVAEWVRQEVLGAGFETGVNFGHCLGLDVVERPIVNTTEETRLRAGMVLTVHPQFVSKDKGATVWIGDTYLVTGGDAEVLTKLDPAETKIVG
ncbi:MAG: aminopeptidase P family protein [Desulfobacteraceae bacterium]|nr:MAG: aminopeptidase P family protein [Desulfobacteraceae bacterium]